MPTRSHGVFSTSLFSHVDMTSGPKTGPGSQERCCKASGPPQGCDAVTRNVRGVVYENQRGTGNAHTESNRPVGPGLLSGEVVRVARVLRTQDPQRRTKARRWPSGRRQARMELLRLPSVASVQRDGDACNAVHLPPSPWNTGRHPPEPCGRVASWESCDVGASLQAFRHRAAWPSLQTPSRCIAMSDTQRSLLALIGAHTTVVTITMQARPPEVQPLRAEG